MKTLRIILYLITALLDFNLKSITQSLSMPSGTLAIKRKAWSNDNQRKTTTTQNLCYLAQNIS